MQKNIDKNLIITDYFNDERAEKIQAFVDTLSDSVKALIRYIFDILKIYSMDNESYIASVYFLSVPKAKLNYDEIEKDFGADVKSMLQKLNEVGFKTSGEADLEYARNMFVGMVKDLRVLIILLAYNVYLTENIGEMDPSERVVFAGLIRDIYAPLASRLGLRDIKNKMEDFAFRFFEPEMYQRLSQDERLNKEERLKQIDITIEKIKNCLKEANITGEVYGREKHLASVYNKLQDKSKTLAQIYDLMAVRVIVSTVEECYAVLGKINGAFTILPNRFKDYIASPKPNGYKSIHTCVLSENNRPIEVQIRTAEMHHFNEYGVAAHWIYKDKKHKHSSMDETISWLKEVIEENQGLSDKEFLENVSHDMFASEIFVQTPNGKIIKFPSGSNCIDFAYAIHSDIGNRCVGAKINGKIVPIATTLQNGDICEIILGAANKGPSRDWLNIVKTNSAKSKINAYFKKQFGEINAKLGKTAVENALKSMNLTLNDFQTSEKLDSVLQKYRLGSIDELYALIGNGNIKAEHVVNRVIEPKEKKEVKLYADKNNKGSKNAIIVGKEKNLLTHIARCCMPVQGDEIIGFLSFGRGVSIHRADCPNVAHLEKSRLIDVEWDENVVENYQVKISTIFDGKAEIMPVATMLEKLNIKIISLGIGQMDSELISVVVVKNQDEIKKITSRLSSIPRVKSSKRV